MRITRETDYAIIAATYLAEQSKPASAAKIAEACDLNASLMSKVLKLLAKAGVLVSTRGVYGGYQLASTPEEISLLDIIVAIEGPMAINACVDHENPCVRLGECDLAPHWRIINQKLYSSFSSISLVELLGQPRQLKRKLAMQPTLLVEENRER